MILLNSAPVDTSSRFPDGTLSLKIPPSLHTNLSSGSFQIDWRYESETELVALLYLTQSLHDSYPYRPINLAMPYVPNARMDRVQNQNEVFTLKFFSALINSLGFSSIGILDPHSPVTPALLNHAYLFPVQPLIEQAVEHIGCDEDSLVLFYPDEGAERRYANLIHRPYNFGVKHRDWHTREILDYRFEGNVDFSGKDVLVVDDICCRGDTFLRAAQLLKDSGARRIYLYCSHCERTVFDGNLLTSGLISQLYTTNSIFNNHHPLITVFDYNLGECD